MDGAAGEVGVGAVGDVAAGVVPAGVRGDLPDSRMSCFFILL